MITNNYKIERSSCFHTNCNNGMFIDNYSIGEPSYFHINCNNKSGIIEKIYLNMSVTNLYGNYIRFVVCNHLMIKSKLEDIVNYSNKVFKGLDAFLTLTLNTPDSIILDNPYHVIPALKSFIETIKTEEKSDLLEKLSIYIHNSLINNVKNKCTNASITLCEKVKVEHKNDSTIYSFAAFDDYDDNPILKVAITVNVKFLIENKVVFYFNPGSIWRASDLDDCEYYLNAAFKEWRSKVGFAQNKYCIHSGFEGNLWPSCHCEEIEHIPISLTFEWNEACSAINNYFEKAHKNYHTAQQILHLFLQNIEQIAKMKNLTLLI